MNQLSFKFRKVESSDFIQLQDLHKRCFGNEATQEYFQWKYLENPAGKAIGFVACDNDIIAGFYGVIPEVFIVNKKRVVVFQSMDTLTSPDYQKKGLFTTLAKITYDYLIAELGTVYIYGIAGPSSLPGFTTKLSWQLTYSIPYTFLSKYVFFTKSLFVKKKRTLFAWEAKFSDINFSNENHIGLRDTVIHPELSLNFLLWRVQQKPNAKYRTIFIADGLESNIVGWVVISLDLDNRCKIEYLNRSSVLWKGSHTQKVMRFIFESYKVDFIYTWKSVDLDLWNIYKSQGFLLNPFSFGPFSYRVPFILYSNATLIEGIEWFRKENFDIQPLMQD